MPYVKQICLVLAVACALLSTAAAQENATAKTTLAITANATGERVRITAPSSIVQMHVEVYAASGEKLFDQEIRGGNVFDWHLQDGQAQRLAPGAYVCVVTAKSVSGKITQKLGTVTVAEKSASVQSSSPQLSLQQTQVIGPVEADSSWTIAAENEPQTPTVIANDGTDGQMIRGRGALSFRIGNFFSGIDQEQMRLTQEGNLGLGTSTPQAKLDVAGTIRAQRFLVVRPNLTSGDKTADTQATDAPDAVQPLIAGTGTQNQIAKWTDNAGTLGDSGITETGTGKVGVGITNPLSKFHVSSNFDALRMTSTNDTTPVWAQFHTSAGTGLGYFGLEGNTAGTFLTGTLPYATVLASGASGTALQLGSAGAVKMTILSGGNVGIGTTAPATPLQVNGLVRATRIGAPGQYIQLFGGDSGSIKLTAQSVAGAEKTLFIQNLSGEGTPNVANAIHFQLGTTASPSTKMIIDVDGNVGIGAATNAGSRLSVAGDFVAISGVSSGNVGVQGEGPIGVAGISFSSFGVGVSGFSATGTGVESGSNSGNLFQGSNNAGDVRFRVANNGQVQSDVGFTTPAADFAELMPVDEPSNPATGPFQPGDVLFISRETGRLRKSFQRYSAQVAGVYSTKPGFLGGQGIEDQNPLHTVPVAMVGIVPTKVSTENGAIRPGDLLATSSTPGYAMKASSVTIKGVKVYPTGAILGKALEPLKRGKGLIKVLVMLR